MAEQLRCRVRYFRLSVKLAGWIHRYLMAAEGAEIVFSLECKALDVSRTNSSLPEYLS